ncbi:MAG: hypothetical protein M1812_002990 [Candelaria pacifica]|nr:MAG: hypothetical protein M1812_002990 [Candelaria pacifica]
MAAPGDLCAFPAVPRTAIVDDRLYFMGGEYTFQGGVQNSTVQRLYWLDLTKGFPVDGLISSNLLISRQALDNSPWDSRGNFFVDPNSTTLYNFARRENDHSTQSSVIAFNATSSQWSEVKVLGDRINYDNLDVTATARTVVSGQGLNFVNSGNDGPAKGLVKFDTSVPDHVFWTNETGKNFPSTQNGAMEYLRAGKAGTLITFGGYDTSQRNPDFSRDGHPFALRPMEVIQIYDIDSNTWYNVNATGSIPQARSAFCSTAAASPDDSSFQITMYGGYDYHSQNSNEDVYVLTVPSFRWIQVSSNNNREASLDKQVGRNSHICEVYREREMIVLGGQLDIGSTTVNSASCNTSYPAIRVLDTSSYTWLTDFTPNPDAYSVSPVISKVIGGSASGGATAKAPIGGFNNSALDSLFSKRVQRFTPPTRSSSAPNFGGTSTPSPSSNHTGAIAGGVVGGVVSLAVIIAALFFFIRFRRSKSENWAKGDYSKTESKPEMEAEMEHKMKRSGGERTPIVEADEGAARMELDGAVRHELAGGTPIYQLSGSPTTR